LATRETQARTRAGRFPGLEEAAAVAHPGGAETVKAEAREEIREERCDEHEIDKP
jgi:hypothetical protein